VLPRPATPDWLPDWYRKSIDAVPEAQLYDLEADLSESHDVAAQHLQIVERLMRLIADAREDLGDYDRTGKNVRPARGRHTAGSGVIGEVSFCPPHGGDPLR